MTAGPSIDPEAFLHDQLAQASPDLMRQLLQTFINTLLSAQADAVCGADYGTRTAERVNRRNGYRHRDLDTRVGTVDVAVPKLREGSYFPEWLLERRKRAEAALATVVATCYLLGVSTRRMDNRAAYSSGFGRLLDFPAATIVQLSEHHAVAELPDGCDLALGDLVRVVPNHVCNAVNLHDVLHPLVDGRWGQGWRVEPRSGVAR